MQPIGPNVGPGAGYFQQQPAWSDGINLAHGESHEFDGVTVTNTSDVEATVSHRHNQDEGEQVHEIRVQIGNKSLDQVIYAEDETNALNITFANGVIDLQEP